MRLYENGVFNTEALKYSVKRLNQLGYFKPLEGPARTSTFEKTPDVDNKVDVKLKLEEQNRNQLTFGAGVSQFEGFFGQLSFQTANFLGRGESLTVSLQAGSRAQNYQLAFTEPFLFDRNITGGVEPVQAATSATSASSRSSRPAASLTLRLPARQRLHADVRELQLRARAGHARSTRYYQTRCCWRSNPFLRDSLLIGQGGERIISKVTPSLVHNTVDQPIFPTTGKRLTRVDRPRGPRRQHQLLQADGSRASGSAGRTAGCRSGCAARSSTSTPSAARRELPIFERLFLGGEYSVRGFDLRTIGPSDPSTGLVLGGNKSLLFNVE